jgi:hypothetical protein
MNCTIEIFHLVFERMRVASSNEEMNSIDRLKSLTDTSATNSDLKIKDSIHSSFSWKRLFHHFNLHSNLSGSAEFSVFSGIFWKYFDKWK